MQAIANEFLQKRVFGFLNINKPKGITSHDVVAYLRRITKIKQIGHTGTLDPFAEGVLPICIGKSTRLIEYLDGAKSYIATVKFGIETDSYDIEGSVINDSGKRVSREDVERGLGAFRGEIFQTPPIYSAIKLNGKKLYEYARAGESVEIKPRKVSIGLIELLHFDESCQEAEIRIECSKGTYIRSIAHDLGQNLGSGAHLTRLIRTQSGEFSINNSVDMDLIKTPEDVISRLLNPADVMRNPKYNITQEEYEQVRNGVSINAGGVPAGEVVILIYNDIINAVGHSDGKRIKIKKVF